MKRRKLIEKYEKEKESKRIKNMKKENARENCQMKEKDWEQEEQKRKVKE